MNRDELEQRLLLYGGDLSRWPQHERETAEHFAATDAAFRALLDEAQRLDTVLAAALGPRQQSGTLAARILASKREREFGSPRRHARWAWRFAGVGAALVITAGVGFTLGALAGGPGADSTDALLMGMAGAEVGIGLLL